MANQKYSHTYPKEIIGKAVSVLGRVNSSWAFMVQFVSALARRNDTVVSQQCGRWDAGFLSEHTSEGLRARCGWSWVSPGHWSVSSHHNTASCRRREIFWTTAWTPKNKQTGVCSIYSFLFGTTPVGWFSHATQTIYIVSADGFSVEFNTNNIAQLGLTYAIVKGWNNAKSHYVSKPRKKHGQWQIIIWYSAVNLQVAKICPVLSS